MDLTIWERIRSKLDYSHLGKPALIGLAALLILVAALAGSSVIEAATAKTFLIEHASGQSTPAEEADASGSADEAAGSLEAEGASGASAAAGQSAAAASAAGDAASGPVFVHVTGAVEKPGLVKMQAGARVADAIEAAGGFAEDANTASVNLARVVSDGEQVVVAREGEEAPSAAPAAQGSPDAGAAADATQGASSQLVNINTASQSELETLSGIGPSTAAKIVADRESYGAFASVDDLTRVAGIGEKKLAAIRDSICV